jgi:DNA polymerase I-like protein with 3'-5' exonuclease and polymerase domains
VHCEFHPLRRVDDDFGGGINGTVSGRFSGTNPNLQNIPARDDGYDLEIGALCRSMFIADEGALWWSQDYSQIEYRFLVHYAVELHCKAAEAAQKEFCENPKADFHELCAKLVWHKDWAEVGRKLLAGEIDDAKAKKLFKALRGPAKNLNFGLVYGMGVDKLAHSLGMVGPDGKPTKECLDLMAAYHAGAPFVKDLTKKCVEESIKNGFITTILGRRGRFNVWEPKFQEKGAKRELPLPEDEARAKWGNKIKLSMTHKALNKRLQGSAADMMKLAMVNIWESGVLDKGNDITCTLTVHDELNGSFVPSARGKAALAEIKRLMETAMVLHVPVLTSGSTGANWAEAK